MAEELNEEDLKLLLTIDPDTTEIEPALVRLGKEIDDIADGGMKKMTDALKSQRGQLANIQDLMGDRRAVLAQQVKQEWDLVEANRALDAAKVSERLKLTRQDPQHETIDLAAIRERKELFHQEEMSRLRMQAATADDWIDPAKVRERLELENKITAARQRYADVEQRIRDDLAGTEGPREVVVGVRTDDARVADQLVVLNREMTAELDKQKDAHAAIKAATDPSLSLLRQEVEGQRQVTAEMEHQAQLAAIRDQMDPSKLADEIRRRKELTAEQEKLNKARANEEHEQNRPGFFQKLMQDPGGSMKEMGSKAGGFFKDMAGEFSKGGVGGVVDKVVGGGAAGGATTGGAGATNMLLGGILGGQGGGGALGQMGGMLGETVGGPVGAMVGEMVGKAVQAGLEMPAKLIAGGFNLIDSSLKSLQGELGPVGMAFDMVGGAADMAVSGISAVSPALGAMVAPLAAIPGTIKSILETLTGFSALASPSSHQQLKLATDDTMAVIGHSFLPMLRMITDGVRLFGDVVATVLPNEAEMTLGLQDIRGMFDEFKEDLRGITSEIGPIVRIWFIGALKLLAVGIKMTVAPIMLLVKGLSMLWSPISDLLGLLGVAAEMRTSEGAAARGTSLQGIDEYQRQLQLEAFKQPGTPGMAQLPTTVDGIARTLTEISNFIRGFTLDGLAGAIRRGLTGGGDGPSPVAAAVRFGVFGNLGGMFGGGGTP